MDINGRCLREGKRSAKPYASRHKHKRNATQTRRGIAACAQEDVCYATTTIPAFTIARRTHMGRPTGGQAGTGDERRSRRRRVTLYKTPALHYAVAGRRWKAGAEKEISITAQRHTEHSPHGCGRTSEARAFIEKKKEGMFLLTPLHTFSSEVASGCHGSVQCSPSQIS